MVTKFHSVAFPYSSLTGRGKKGFTAISCRIALPTTDLATKKLPSKAPHKENKQDVASLGFCCVFFISRALFGAILLRISDERPLALTTPWSDSIPYSGLLHDQLVGLPEHPPMWFDALDGLNTAEIPSSCLCLHLPPFCQMSLQICSKKNLLQVFLILE